MAKLKRLAHYNASEKSFEFKNRSEAGVHILADFWFGKIIDKKSELKKILLNAAKKSNSTPLEIFVVKFKPQGITGIALLAESHISVHSWPEINYIGIDIFTCGEKATPMDAFEYLKKEFKPKKVELKEIKRGVLKI